MLSKLWAKLATPDSPREGVSDAYSAMRRAECIPNDEPNFSGSDADGGAPLPGRPSVLRIARATALLRERIKHSHSTSCLEKKSVYGAAILIPQLARSAGWPMDFLFLTLKVYIFLFMNYLIQFMLLAAIEKEESVMDLFSGQMYLCDFGAPIDLCPDSPSCLGPGGSQISGPRLYTYQSWAIRSFVKDTLKSVFPERAHLVEEMVDTGEYGAESREIRWLCCFIFMMDVMSECENVFRMCRFLFHVPTASQPWIHLSQDDGENGADGKRGQPEALGVRIAGMPLRWKVFSFLAILVPKALLWRLTAEAGICFLMETAAIDDMIVNAVGLTFILQVDESICATLMSTVTQELLEECSEFDSATNGDAQETSGKEAQNLTLRQRILGALYGVVPMRLVSSLLLTSFFVLKYYYEHCVWRPEGSFFASKSMYLPETTAFTIWNALLPTEFPVKSEPTPYWTMPER